MTPNPVGTSISLESAADMGKVGNMNSAPAELSDGRYLLHFTQGCLNLLGYLIIGVIVGVNLVFAYRFGPNLSSLNIHIVMCVLGFQLLMGVGMLVLASGGGFTDVVSLKHKRWLHIVLQIVGSIVAIVGCFIMSLAKSVNFDTIHGQFALVSMVFTIACLFNGAASHFSYELRKCLPASLSKLTHILFGIAAFATATVSLCYGFQKTSFRNWATEEFTVVLYVFSGIFTAICIMNPFITFFNKLSNTCSN